MNGPKMSDPKIPVREAFGLLLFVFSCHAALWGGDSPGRRFEAQGRLKWYGKPLHSKNSQHFQTVGFHVWVDGRRWIIEEARTDLRFGDITNTYGYDGKDFYLTRRAPPERISPNPGESTNSLEWKATLEAARRGEIAEAAEVWPHRIYPYADGKGASLLWLAFCSACGFRHNLSTNLPLVFFVPSTAHVPLRLSFKLQRHAEDPDLITQFTAYNPGYSISPRDKKRLYDPPPFNKPWVYFRYYAADFARLGAIYVPKRFVCEWYGLENIHSTNRYVIDHNKPLHRVKQRWVEGITEAVRPLAHPITGRPKLHAFFAVTDHRAEEITGGKPIQYLTYTDWWQTNDPRFLKALQTPDVVALPKKVPSSKLEYRLLFFVFVIMTAALYGYFTWQKNKQSKERRNP